MVALMLGCLSQACVSESHMLRSNQGRQALELPQTPARAPVEEWAPFPETMAASGQTATAHRRNPRRYLGDSAPKIASDSGSRQARSAVFSAAVARMVSRASALVGRHSLGSSAHAQGLPNDCTGFVRLAYLEAGVDLMDSAQSPNGSGVEAIYRRARAMGAVHRRALPQRGDLVFFRETYDRNRDGRRNDGLTHIGIVEDAEDDGTVIFLHRANSGVRRSRLNLRLAHVHRDTQGRLLNDYLRKQAHRTRAYLTGELFSGFASADLLFKSASLAQPSHDRVEVSDLTPGTDHGDAPGD
jgi:cell wall-associated NlpC family hydrolase